MTELELSIQQWFLDRWQEAKKGGSYSIDEVSRAIGRDKDEIISAVNRGIIVTNSHERRWQNVIFANTHLLALDTEDVVRACLAEFLKIAGYRVIGRPGCEIDFKSSFGLRKILEFASIKPNVVDIDQYFASCVTSYGLDLVAFRDGRVLIVEAKGVTAAKSDFNETIFQMLNRYERMKAICTEQEFAAIVFACAFPYFRPCSSRDHYVKQFSILDLMWRTKEARMLYQFAAATNVRKAEGLSRMEPFVTGSPNICQTMDNGNIKFLLVESMNSVSAIGGKPSNT